MIKVIKGTVGAHINGRNITRSTQDAPFSLSEEEEARFVALGVAAYYSTGEIGPELQKKLEEFAEETDVVETSADAEDTTADAQEEDDTLESMGFPELRNLAKQMGLSASGKREDIIARISEANKVIL